MKKLIAIAVLMTCVGVAHADPLTFYWNSVGGAVAGYDAEVSCELPGNTTEQATITTNLSRVTIDYPDEGTCTHTVTPVNGLGERFPALAGTFVQTFPIDVIAGVPDGFGIQGDFVVSSECQVTTNISICPAE